MIKILKRLFGNRKQKQQSLANDVLDDILSDICPICHAKMSAHVNKTKLIGGVTWNSSIQYICNKCGRHSYPINYEAWQELQREKLIEKRNNKIDDILN